MKTIESKFLIFALIAIFILFVYTQGNLIFKSIKILNGMFSEEESNFFEKNKPEEVVLDEQTKLYIFKPSNEGEYPAIIFSLGLWESGTDDALENPVESLIDSGFVVLLVESKDTKDGFITENGRKSLVSAFTYLENKNDVKKDKIGFLGISVGSSIAFIAAGSPEISEDVLFILWLGGYYDINDYIIDVFSESIIHNGKIIDYKPDSKIKETMILNLMNFDKDLVNKLNSTKDRNELKFILENSSAEVKEKLEEISPQNYIDKVNAKVFVIHDRNDSLVPFTESIHLSEEKKLTSFVLTEIVTHAVPKIDVGAIQSIKEYTKLIFLTKDILILT